MSVTRPGTVATAAGGKETRGRGEEAVAQVVREKGLETETGNWGGRGAAAARAHSAQGRLSG